MNDYDRGISPLVIRRRLTNGTMAPPKAPNRAADAVFSIACRRARSASMPIRRSNSKATGNQEAPIIAPAKAPTGNRRVAAGNRRNARSPTMPAQRNLASCTGPSRPRPSARAINPVNNPMAVEAHRMRTHPRPNKRKNASGATECPGKWRGI